MIPLLIFVMVIAASFHQKSVAQRVAELQSRGNIISNLVLSSAFLTNDMTSDVESEIIHVADTYKGRILILDAKLRVQKDTYGLDEGRTILTNEAIQCLSEKHSQIVNQKGDKIEIYMPVTSTDQKTVLGVIVMDFSLRGIEALQSAMSNVSSTMIVLLFILIVIIAILCSKRIVMPLTSINETLHHISDGYIDETVDLKGYTEVEEVGKSFNEMTEVLHNLEDSRQEFVSNVSHELKTPITSIRVLADSLTTQEEAPVELYREFMVDINTELERLDKIINDLLSLVKMDKNASKMTVTEVNMNEFIENILKHLRPIAGQRNIEIIFESFRQVNAQIDDVKMGMAFTNLIENAIKYNYDDGWVRISLNADHKFFYLKVSDSGVGIPEDLQEQVFERFYRVDKARSRETGGNGLGLAIARNAILLHRGSIRIHSVEQQGTTFNIRIPLNYLA